MLIAFLYILNFINVTYISIKFLFQILPKLDVWSFYFLLIYGLSVINLRYFCKRFTKKKFVLENSGLSIQHVNIFYNDMFNCTYKRRRRFPTFRRILWQFTFGVGEKIFVLCNKILVLKYSIIIKNNAS